jgi:uncharacterized membrane protein YgcG
MSQDWWQRSMTLMRLRRGAPIGIAGGAAALLGGGCMDYTDEVRPDNQLTQRNDDFDTSMRALALQENEGWDVGDPDRPLALARPSPVDAYGSYGWRVEEVDLYARLQPARNALLPYYVPTLFQSLVGPGSERLLAQIRPSHTPEMDNDFGRGLALRQLFEQAGFPNDTAIVVDAPGARSVAIAAALADRFDPVFEFGNWPHPLGVVPAQETLAAALFYLPIFESTRRGRAVDAPPVFVLDANRLLPYRDADTQFDNRYLSQLPSAEQLAALGIHHLLYVNSDGQPELDDLNGALVDLCARGVDVKVVALSDFQAGEAPENEAAEPVLPDEDAPSWAFAVDWFWYGGDPGWQVAFWDDYGWYHPPRVVWVGPPHKRRCVTVGPPRAMRKHMSLAFASHPTTRSTLFHFNGGRALAPQQFGFVAVRSSRSDGTVTAVRAGGYQAHFSSTRSSGWSGGSSGGWSAGARGGYHAFGGGGGRSGSLGRAGGGFSG